GFFQIVMLENSADATLNINAEPIDNLNNSVTFASPEHVLTWVRGDAQRGFIVYFKDTFLAHYQARIQDAFPYFRLTEVNDVHPDGEAKARLHDHCARLLATFRRAHPYRVQMLQALLLVLLFDCKHMYEHQAHIARQAAPNQVLTDRFQQLIHQHYLNRKTVEAYAAMLGVSPDYLSHIVKSTTGKGASQHIAERILLEAKKLLVYSDLNIAEIAHYLGYSEPTHFGRFFRRHTQLNPLAWRNQNR
ncbi:MAG: helix-turn-helix transcriptional regulator, partial [Chitinophagaceae bacterium]|nr:helix-turn-helix transcriptional regulator [Anaerolineae bacterium]